ncbi:hypothetical protein MHO82_12025 [Vibrio sp. Of7-15]|uniref:hypothetical protein n=1 Tax=Vibrio sp. Of7-15 TaxID=2724879 RepID=UPI001EF393DF|nr:hypothetical protein [Vibrio sp. Of7-15]MCG7497593.1 hypothetical protein [Vibrio sp. Of7-15]
MKHYLIPAITVALMTGCISTSLTPPPSDFVGKVPAEVNESMKELNHLEPIPFHGGRGGYTSFHYDENTALLTIVRKLKGNRWEWGVSKSESKEALLDIACNNFKDELDSGVGIREWRVGNKGFVSDIVTSESCNDYQSKNNG